MHTSNSKGRISKSNSSGTVTLADWDSLLESSKKRVGGVPKVTPEIAERIRAAHEKGYSTRTIKAALEKTGLKLSLDTVWRHTRFQEGSRV